MIILLCALLWTIVITGFIIYKNRSVSTTGKKQKYLYQAKKHLMTNAEEKCFNTLCNTFGSKFWIIPQIHLSALLDHRIKGQNWKHAFNHINGKSVDFVLLDKKTLQPICAVELDDRTHQQSERIKRDLEVEQIFDQANLPLVRLPKTPNNTNKKELIGLFAAVINKNNKQQCDFIIYNF